MQTLCSGCRLCSRDFEVHFSGEAARTRSAAQRSLRERDVLARQRTTETELDSKRWRSRRVEEAVWLFVKIGKESDCTVFFGRILRLASYVQGLGKGKEWGRDDCCSGTRKTDSFIHHLDQLVGKSRSCFLRCYGRGDGGW